jgi:uncharacterized membrane protein (DUF373 family)
MSNHNVDIHEQMESEHTSSGHASPAHLSHPEEVDMLAMRSGNFLDRADTIVYAVVGVCFLLGALCALVYTFWDFGISLMVIPSHPLTEGPGLAAEAIIQFISGLLLVLIIVEVLGTVTHYLKSHETSLRPFLFIGIVSAIRSVLSVGARLSVSAAGDFNHSMIELGVSAAVVVALGITLKILGNLTDAHL